MLSSSIAPARDSEKQRQYGLRCALLREEQYRRGSLCSQETNGRAQLCIVYVEASDAEWALEHARERSTACASESPPPLYTYRYRAGATVSVLPVGQSVKSLHESLDAADDPLTAEVKLLELWESENRAELEEWEFEERHEMAHEIQCILVAQRERDCVVRECACRRVMSGATSLDWASYPRYEGTKLLSGSPQTCALDCVGNQADLGCV
ncbi:hypothetical protein JIQ42_01562 [Leishmania sp. Namibia]|uniref:hypothetical protein n=1 Tax=Leishmania sp. Namibia TaxID=2802991 RepID=UPI001B4A6591|nr:hypothetical protein JIQ42_01562 [Leishmania sp. Namibia]